MAQSEGINKLKVFVSFDIYLGIRVWYPETNELVGMALRVNSLIN